MTLGAPLGRLFWLVADDYKTAQPEFDYIRHHLEALDMVEDASTFKPDARSYIKLADDFGGAIIETVSGNEPYKVRAKAPDGIVGCEVGKWSKELFQRVLERLVETRGWLWLCGTWENSAPWMMEVWSRWQGANEETGASFSMPSWTNTDTFPGGRADPAFKPYEALLSAGQFMERFGGEPCPPTGAVYSEFDAARHVSKDATYVAGVPVYLWVDPGYDGYAVEVVQVRDNTVMIVDEIYEQGLTHDQVLFKVERAPWCKDVSYVVMDIAGTQHHADRSAVETWRAKRFRVVFKRVHVTDEISRVRTFLHSDGTVIPRFVVHPKWRGVLAEMDGGPSPIVGGGRYMYKTDSEGGLVDRVPISKNCHASTAIAYGLIEMFGLVERPKTSVGHMWADLLSPQKGSIWPTFVR